jgi:hypothetical protein
VGLGVGLAFGLLALIALVLLVVLFIVRKRRATVTFYDDAAALGTQSVQSLLLCLILYELMATGILRQETSGYELDRKSIIINAEIGSGEFGLVMKAIGISLPGCLPAQSVAVKVLKSSHTESDTNAFIREGMRLLDLHHPNIVKTIGVCMQSEPLMIVLEFQVYGDLKGLLRACHEKKVPLEQQHFHLVARNVLAGFLYLQERRFVHRDLAARNVLVGADHIAKIGDFGLRSICC